MNLERSKLISLLTIPFFLLITVILFFMNGKTIFEPLLVLPILNTVFLGIIPLFIAFIAYRTYRTRGSVSVLLLGSGMLVFGLGSIDAGWLNVLPGGANITPTIHNTSVCIGAIFSLVAVLFAFSGSIFVSKKGGVYIPLFVYGGIVAFVALFSFAAVAGLIPPFFIQGTGPTVLRQVILSNATEMYALTSVLFFILYTRKKDDFFFWFSIGLALIATGLGAVFIQPAVGSLVGWAGRIAQYAGACFAFVAFIVLRRSATKEGIPSPDLLARFFGTSETGYKILVETAPDAIVVIRDNRFLYANDAALHLYGAETFDELRLKTVIDLVLSEEREGLMNQLDQIQGGISLPGQDMRIIRHDGSIIDVAVRAASIDYLGTPAVIGIIRDITPQKKSEEALRLQDQELQLKNSQLQALFDYSAASLVLFDAKPPYTVLAHNRYYQELWAEPFRSQGLVGKNIFDYVPGVEVQGVKEVYDEVVRTRQAKNLIGFPYDGMERGRTWWNWHLSPIIRGDTVVALAHMAFDITREVEARIKAEEALSLLKASEDRLSLAQEAAGAGAWDWDIVTGEIDWAPRLYELFGINPGMTPASFDVWNTILHPDEGEGANARIRQALDQHTILDSEYRIMRPDGTIRWINARGRGIYDNAGKPVRMYGICLDITGRKQAEAALRESEERYRMIVDTAQEGIVLTDPEGKIIFVNERFAQLLGYSAGELVGKAGLDLAAEKERVSAGKKINERRKGEREHYEIWMLRKDGREVCMLTSGNPIQDSEGKHLGNLGMYTDITERKHTEKALLESESILRNFFDSSGVMRGIVEVIAENDVLHIADNSTTASFIGLTPEAMKNKKGSELGEPLDIMRMWIGHYLESQRSGKPVTFEYRDTRGDTAAWLHVTVSYLAVSPSGNPRFAYAVLDITERKRIEEALRESQVRTATILEGIADTFYSLDDQWRFTIVNPAAEKAPFGRPADELVGKVIWDLYPNLVGTRIHQHYLDAAEKHSFEHYASQSPLNQRWYEVFMQGRRGGVDIFMRDITERKQAEEALRESEEKYRSIVETANEGIIIVDAESRIIYVNDKFADLLGYPPDELIGTSSIDFFDKEYVAPALEEREQRRHRGARASYESRFIRKDGQSLWALVNSSPVLDKTGKFAGSLGMVTDITERRQAEQRIESLLSDVRNEKDRLSALINSISDEIWYADSEKKFTLANPSALEEFRLRNSDEIDVENLAISLEVFRQDGSPRPVDEAPPLRALTGEMVRNQIEIIRTPWHGELRYRQVSATPVRDDQGTIIGSVSVVRDITDLKQVEETLRNTSQYLENLIDYANAPIIVWDPDFRITRFNHAFERLTGRKAEDVIGQRLELLFPEKYPKIAMDIIRRTTSGERLDVVEIPILHVSGTVRTVLWNSATLFESDGKTVHSTIAQGSDITERKRAEEELVRRNEDLNAAYEEIMATQEELQQSNNELLESEQELRKASLYLENLINYANAPIVVWDPNFVITRFNHAFEELTGRTAREIIGQRLEVLFPPRYLDASMEIIRKTMFGERLKVVEIPILNRRGEIRIVLWNSATLFESDGATIHSTIAQGNDITERKMTEAELEERNEELNSAIEELTRQRHELNEALKEKEVLLSEVHHRVKNNLTAFISLLSLESTYDDSVAGLALKKDLQNRARSMALIHETLYKTKKYSRVNMDVYLTTLVGQITDSYESAKLVQTSVDAHGITLDLSRATPGGLIINELLTNSLKYAFPPSFDCEKIRGSPCTIAVQLTGDDGAYILTVRDNGIGLPGNLDIATTKTLGLKLVNFLAKHQLRASIEVHSDKGSEFRFRFRDKV
jgi:PAS domain S-box-containing protein